MAQGEGGRPDHFAGFRLAAHTEATELGRRNPAAIAMDILYLITIAFFTVLATHAWAPLSIPFVPIWIPFSWPMVVALIPLAGLLYFGWRSSIAFFLAQLGIIVLTIAAVSAGIVPF